VEAWRRLHTQVWLQTWDTLRPAALQTNVSAYCCGCGTHPGHEDHGPATELLLQLTNEPGLHLLELPLQAHRDLDHNGLLPAHFNLLQWTNRQRIRLYPSLVGMCHSRAQPCPAHALAYTPPTLAPMMKSSRRLARISWLASSSSRAWCERKKTCAGAHSAMQHIPLNTHAHARTHAHTHTRDTHLSQL